LGELTGQVVNPGASGTKFEGFDRNPYLVAFKAGKLTFLLADVHLYFGDEDEETGMDRSLERNGSRLASPRRVTPSPLS
jgi:hypothetical protein